MSSVTSLARMRRVMLVLAAAAVVVVMRAFSPAPALADPAIAHDADLGGINTAEPAMTQPAEQPVITEPAQPAEQPVMTEPGLDNDLGLVNLDNGLGFVTFDDALGLVGFDIGR